MLLIAAVSLKRAGMQSQSLGTMVRWPEYTMGICVKSKERRQGRWLYRYRVPPDKMSVSVYPNNIRRRKADAHSLPINVHQRLKRQPPHTTQNHHPPTHPKLPRFCLELPMIVATPFAAATSDIFSQRLVQKSQVRSV